MKCEEMERDNTDDSFFISEYLYPIYSTKDHADEKNISQKKTKKEIYLKIQITKKLKMTMHKMITPIIIRMIIPTPNQNHVQISENTTILCTRKTKNCYTRNFQEIPTAST